MNKKINDFKLVMKISFEFLWYSNRLMPRVKDMHIWKRKFMNLLYAGDVRTEKLLEEFFTCQIEKVKNDKIKRKNKYAPILFCVIKNDINKIEKFMEHYRNLGVEVFVFLDNNSNDGTREFLCHQKDTIVYCSKQSYSSVRRIAWLNRLLAIYGTEQWCLIVDSDELITYIGYEKYPLSDIIKKAITHHYLRIEGFLLDMYSDENLFQESEKDYVTYCRYFDRNSYRINVKEHGVVITGGPRRRVFGTEVCLSKYPLFFLGKDDIIASSHHMVPSEPIKNCPIWLAICHYKFNNEEDLKKIKEAVHNENYAMKSAEYKKYLSTIKNKEDICFYDKEYSCVMENSCSLKKFSFLKSPFVSI